MIDTDKYEGLIDAEGYIDYDGIIILLSEVKQLREALVTVQRSLIWDEEDRAMDGDPITLEALVAQVEQVRSDITEMIE